MMIQEARRLFSFEDKYGNHYNVVNGKIKDEVLNSSGKPFKLSEQPAEFQDLVKAEFKKQEQNQINNVIKEYDKTVAERKVREAEELQEDLKQRAIRGEQYLDLEESIKQKAKEESDIRNAEFLRNEHVKKESEYSEFWNSAIDRKELEHNIGNYAEALGANKNIVVDDCKVIIEDGKLTKIINKEGKEIEASKLDSNFLEKIKKEMAKSYEIETILPVAKKKIKELNKMFKKHVSAVQKIMENLDSKIIENAEFEKGSTKYKEVVVKQGEYDYMILVRKYDNKTWEPRSFVVKNKGKEVATFDDCFSDGIKMEYGDVSCMFKYVDGGNKLKLTGFDTGIDDSMLSKRGDVLHLNRPYYNQKPERWRVDYSMGNYEKDLYYSFFSDLNNYYSKEYLNG